MKFQTLPETLTLQYNFTSMVFIATVKDLTEDQALHQPEPNGNCINWVAGHLVQSRCGTLKVLGLECPIDSSPYDRYERSTDPVLANDPQAVTLEEIMAGFAATGQALLDGFKELTPEQAAAPAPFSPLKRDDETIGSLLAGLFFHESYHVGQLGLLRRLAGADSIIK